MKSKGLIAIIILVILGGVGYLYSQQAGAGRVKDAMMVEDKMTGGEMIEDDTIMIGGYIDISPAEAKKMIDENPDLMIIDVSPKYEEGHLPGAVNYYVGDGSLEEVIPSLDKEADYLVYCHVDSASIQGAEMLVEAGFENVYRLEGNYSAWVAAGYKIEK